MKMQDKEIDELFRSNLDDLEVKPLAGVWDGIEAELERGRRKRVYIPFLSIAASIIALFTIGLLFIPRKADLRVNVPSQKGFVNTSTSGLKNTAKETIVKNSHPDKINNPLVSVDINKVIGGQSPAKQNDSTKDEANALMKNNEKLAAINTSSAAIIVPVLPDENTRLTSLQPIEIKAPLTVEPQQTIAALPAINEKSPAVKPKHNVLSLSGLINAMVAKVDKRQDKIIEFTDDDGESSITGINLGIIKIKKDQKTTEK